MEKAAGSELAVKTSRGAKNKIEGAAGLGGSGKRSIRIVLVNVELRDRRAPLNLRGVTYRFDYRRYSLPFRAPVRTAHGVWTLREGLIVRLEDETGRVCLGEVAPIPWFGSESVEEAEAACSELGKQVTAEQLESVPARFVCTRFGLRTAVDQPTTQSGGPAYLPMAALLSAGRAALAEITAKADAGFRTFKWKVGVADAADELVLLDDLVARLPSGGMLRLDANGAWDRRRAERWLERAVDRPVEFIEQPIAVDAKGAADLLLGLAHDYPTPIALDESVVSDAHVVQWLGAGWPGFFVIKPSLLGDVRRTLGRLRDAKARVVFSSALETAVGARAALQLAFEFSSEPRALGFGVWPLFNESVFNGPAAGPFLRVEDIQRLNTEEVWNALN